MRRHHVVVAVLAAATAATGALVWHSDSGATTTSSSSLTQPHRPTELGASPALARSPTDPVPQAPRAPDSLDFDAAVAALVELLQEGRKHLAGGDVTRAQEIDTRAGDAIKQVLSECHDYDVRALWSLTGLADLSDSRARDTRAVLGNFVRFGLQKYATASAGRALHAYVDALIEAIVPHEHNGVTIAALLTDQPYLGESHEPAVLRLLELVPTYPWLARPARKLLLTLWHNLGERDASARDRIETLALMLKDDTNPARRAAALEHLLQRGDRSLVDFVVADIEEQRDAERARDLALVAASKLPADHALEVFARLRRPAARSLMAGAIELGRRAPEQVRARYEELRSAAADADLRADLVTGMGFNPSTESCVAVWSAWQTDPSMDVRERALFALTANAASSYGERAVEAALADAAFCGKHGERLCAVVACIGNLARSGETAAVARLVQRCRARRDLAPQARDELEAIARGELAGRPPATNPR